MGPTGPHFFQAINLTTAKVLGLIFPDKLLALADEVIEKGASFAAPPHSRSWRKTSAGDVCSDVGDWMMNGHIAGSAVR